MTFSEFISIFGWQHYLQYCRDKKITPVKDLAVPVEKPCALLDKTFTPNKNEQPIKPNSR
jgi:hypothetical protein